LHEDGEIVREHEGIKNKTCAEARRRFLKGRVLGSPARIC
jgi:hypothetical protein